MKGTRMKIGNRYFCSLSATLACLLAFCIMGSHSARGESVLVGWNSFPDPAGSFDTSGSPKTQDAGITGIVGSMYGGDGSRGAEGSTDGTYGSAFPVGNTSTNGAMTMRMLDPGESNLTFTITNNSGSDWSLERFVFDYTSTLGGGGTPSSLDTLTLNYLSGDLDDADNTVIGSLSDIDEAQLGSTVGDYFDASISISAVLSDVILSHGESATFSLVGSNTDASGTDSSAIRLDSFAFTAEPTSSLFAGWNSFPGPDGSFTAVGSPKTQDAGISGVVGSMYGGDGSRGAEGSTDGTYGSAFPVGNTSTNGAMTMRMLDPGESNLTFTITNNSGSDWSLERFVFDYTSTLGGGGTPSSLDTLTLNYLSGDLDDADNTVIGSLSDIDEAQLGSTVGDYFDASISISAVLSDVILSNGQSATFSLVGSNTDASGDDGVAIRLDNFAFTAKLVPAAGTIVSIR